MLASGWITLKQTQSENGRVTMTSPHDMAVRIQPHRPIPLSVSSAIMYSADQV